MKRSFAIIALVSLVSCAVAPARLPPAELEQAQRSGARLADIKPLADVQSVREFLLTRSWDELKGHKGLVMDVASSQGVLTVVAFSDGSASVTSTSGATYVGAGHPALFESARDAARAALSDRSLFMPTTDLTPPPPGSVRFYALGWSRLLSTPAVSLREVQRNDHRYYPVWAAMEGVVQILKAEPSL